MCVLEHRIGEPNKRHKSKYNIISGGGEQGVYPNSILNRNPVTHSLTLIVFFSFLFYCVERGKGKKERRKEGKKERRKEGKKERKGKERKGKERKGKEGHRRKLC